MLVKVYDYELRESDFKKMFPKNLTNEDSVYVAQQMISDWVKDKAVLSRAENNLSADNKDFQDKLEDYRNSLIIYTYEKELVNQKLDTIISEEEIRTFFNDNLESFKLKNSILQLWFMSVSIDAPNKNKLTQWFSRGDDQDLIELEDYCNTYAESCLLAKNEWIYTDDIQKQTGLVIEDWEKLLRGNHYFELENDKQLHIFRVFDYRLRGSDAPLELERQNVENLLLNKRKANLIKKMRDNAVQEAYSKEKVIWGKE